MGRGKFPPPCLPPPPPLSPNWWFIPVSPPWAHPWPHYLLIDDFYILYILVYLNFLTLTCWDVLYVWSPLGVGHTYLWSFELDDFCFCFSFSFSSLFLAFSSSSSFLSLSTSTACSFFNWEPIKCTKIYYIVADLGEGLEGSAPLRLKNCHQACEDCLFCKSKTSC